jgi:hypothetical protein
VNNAVVASGGAARRPRGDCVAERDESKKAWFALALERRVFFYYHLEKELP